MAKGKKKNSSRRSDKEFAEAIIEILNPAATPPGVNRRYNALEAADRRAADDVASGLFVIKALLHSEELRQGKNLRFGLLAAFDWLDSIKNGPSGPIKRYLRFINSRRPGASAASRLTCERRAWLVAVASALRLAAKRDGRRITLPEAAALSSKMCLQTDEKKVSADVMRKWRERGLGARADKVAMWFITGAERYRTKDSTFYDLVYRHIERNLPAALFPKNWTEPHPILSKEKKTYKT
jgi:hypothetical protein